MEQTVTAKLTTCARPPTSRHKPDGGECPESDMHLQCICMCICIRKAGNPPALFHSGATCQAVADLRPRAVITSLPARRIVCSSSTRT